MQYPHIVPHLGVDLVRLAHHDCYPIPGLAALDQLLNLETGHVGCLGDRHGQLAQQVDVLLGLHVFLGVHVHPGVQLVADEVQACFG